MSATKEKWQYRNSEKVWTGMYRNSQNTMHWHSDCELIYCQNGLLDVTADGGVFRIKKGDALFIDSECLHKINAIQPDSLLKTIVFDSAIIADFAREKALCSPLLTCDYGIDKLYSYLMRELSEKRPLYTFSTENAVRGTVIEFFRDERTTPKKPKSQTDQKLKELFREIQEHYDSFTLDDAALFMNMNASYLSRLFTAKTGMHLMRYVNCVRVEHAVDRLTRGDGTVTEICTDCGFATIRNFNRIFKILTGYSPSGLPKDYVFTAAVAEKSGFDVNPTLPDCVLVESSDDS